MSKQVKLLQDKMARLLARGQEIADKDGELTAEDRQELDRIAAELKATREDLNRVRAVDQVRAEVDRAHDEYSRALRVGTAPGARRQINDSDLLRRWVLNVTEQDRQVEDELRATAAQIGWTLNGNTARIPVPVGHWGPGQVFADLARGSDPAGGYTVPETLRRAIEVALKQFGTMFQVSTVLRTRSGEDLVLPTANDTGNEGEILAENAAGSTASVDPTFGALTLGAYNYWSKFIRVSNALLRDSAFDLARFLGDKVGERIARVADRHFTVGTGTGQPTGIVTAAPTVQTAALGSLSADDVITLIHSVEPAYRNANFALMMHDSILLNVSLLKDGNGAYLLRPTGSTSGFEAQVAVIRGWPVVVNQAMDSAVASGNKVIVAGDLSKYHIRQAGELRIVRAVERFVEYDQTAVAGFWGQDGGLLDAGTNPVKVLQVQ